MHVDHCHFGCIILIYAPAPASGIVRFWVSHLAVLAGGAGVRILAAGGGAGAIHHRADSVLPAMRSEPFAPVKRL